MNLKNIVLVIVGVILLAALFFVLRPSQATAPSLQNIQQSEEKTKESATVEIENYAFQPQTIRIKAGETVTWINRDDVGHSATADDESFDTGILEKGKSKSITFNQAGTFAYYCVPHPNMRATVIVEEADVSSDQAGGEKVFTLVIQGKKLTSGPANMQVTEGETVVIAVTSDEAEELHVHGYDQSVQLLPGEKVELQFTASITGRFPIELEESQVEIGALEVQPK